MLNFLGDVFFVWAGGVIGMGISIIQDTRGVYALFSTKKKVGMALIWPWYLIQRIYHWIKK